jgi:hypothetical protein
MQKGNHHQRGLTLSTKGQRQKLQDLGLLKPPAKQKPTPAGA